MKTLSTCRELDTRSYAINNEIRQLTEQLLTCASDKKSQIYARITKSLLNLQDINDEKLHLSQTLSEMIESRYRGVENDHQKLVQMKRDETLGESSLSKQNQQVVASVLQQEYAGVQLQSSSKAGSNTSSSAYYSASEVRPEAASVDRGTKRMKRTRNDASNDLELDRVDVYDQEIKIEPTSVSLGSSICVAAN